MATLTAKQEIFSLGVIAGLKPTESHLRAYPNKMKLKTRQEASSRLMKNSKVLARINELRRPAAVEAEMTLSGHLRDLMGLRNKAVKANQYGSAVSAEIARGKASGVHVEQTKREHSGPNGQPLMVPKLTVVIGADPVT